MTTIFNQSTIDGIIQRIEKLSSNAQAKWGKMNTHQMVKHCILSEKMYLGDTKYKRLFIGKLFGKMALKSMVKDDKPLKQNQPTHPTFKTQGNGEIEHLKKDWINLVKEYSKRNDTSFGNFTHPFFGKMTKEQLGISVYKHIDHHLRQFGA